MTKPVFSVRSCLFLAIVLISAAAVFSASGCSSSGSSDNIPNANANFETGENNSIIITEQALGKEILLLSHSVEQENLQEFNALKSKVVMFEKIGDKVIMSDVTGGKAVESSIPTKLLLAEFPILNSSQGRLKIDFSKGVSTLFVGSAYNASDFSGLDYSPDNTSIKTNFSIVESASAGNNLDLTVKLIAQVEATVTSKDGGNIIVSSPTKAFTFHFIPYNKNDGFTPTLTPGQYQLGFFETPTLFSSHGDTVIYAMKVDKAKKPIVYALSSNTPAEYRTAIREGVLFWNMVLGEEFVSVIDAPDGVSAPDPRYNVIQWIDNLGAGFAYANFHGDPRTGEILHAEIYLTSVFALGGYSQAWFYQKLFQERELNSESAGRNTFTLKNFESQHLCNYDTLKAMAELSEMLINAGATDEQFQLAANDYLREVVCHEVGHTLGLRHNFAGSLGVDYKGQDRYGLLDAYLKTGYFPTDMVPSTSIMDYTDRIERLFNGAQIREGVQTVKYDEIAMKYLYNQASITGMPVFCTDSDNGKFLDCLAFDCGRSPFEGGMEEIELYMDADYIPLYVFRQFIYAKSTRPGFIPIDASAVYLNYKEMAGTIITPRINLLKAFTADGLYVRTFKRDMPGRKLSDIIAADLRSRTIPDVLADAQNYISYNKHGITKVSDFFFTVPENLAASWKASMAKMLADPSFISGLGPTGDAYVFTSSEIDDVKNVSSTFFDNLQAELVALDISVMVGKTYDVSSGELGDGLLEALYNAEVTYLLEEKSSETIAAHVNGTVGLVYVNLPVFANPWKLRLTATGLLSPSRVVESARLWWAKDEASDAYSEFTGALDDIFMDAAGKSFADVKTDMLNPALNSDEAQWWYMENDYIKSNFTAK